MHIMLALSLAGQREEGDPQVLLPYWASNLADCPVANGAEDRHHLEAASARHHCGGNQRALC